MDWSSSSKSLNDQKVIDVDGREFSANHNHIDEMNEIPIELNSSTQFVYEDDSSSIESPKELSYRDMNESTQSANLFNRFSLNYLLAIKNRFFTSLDETKIHHSHCLRLSKDSVDLNLNQCQTCNQQKQWALNYGEAAIYLEEGINNDKFKCHPDSFRNLAAYFMVHNWIYNFLDLFCVLILLSLALFEKPAHPSIHLHEMVHASIELLCLILISLTLMLKMFWISFADFLRHKRSLIKAVILAVMIVEAFIVFWRQDSHIRITRSLRSLLLLDNHYCHGVRRVVRQTTSTFTEFFKCFLLVLFFVSIFSLMGYSIFSPIIGYEDFSSLPSSMINMFILVTTTNFPDIMMPAYQTNSFAPVFFISYVIITLYFTFNIMLAVIYVKFSILEKEKFKKLYMHRRQACAHAFKRLVTVKYPHHIKFEQFNGLLSYFCPKTVKPLDRYLMYKALVNNTFDDNDNDRSSTPIIDSALIDNRFLSLEKFYHIYEVIDFRWHPLQQDSLWLTKLKPLWIREKLFFLRDLVLSQNFQIFWGFLTIWSAFIALISFIFQYPWIEFYYFNSFCFGFIFYCLIVTIVELITIGSVYWASSSKKFDALLTFLAIFVTLVVTAKPEPSRWKTLVIRFVYTARLYRLLSLLKKRVEFYNDVFGPFGIIIVKRFCSVILILSIVFYSFAIIGMEFLGSYSLIDCCQNTTIESYYRANGTTSYYYLINFNDLLKSYVTLFHLFLVNNWQITMKAYIIVTESWATYIYFLSFYVISLVVLTAVLAFVIDAFQFYIKYKQNVRSQVTVELSVDVKLTREEILMIESYDQSISFSNHRYGGILNQIWHFIYHMVTCSSFNNRYRYEDNSDSGGGGVPNLIINQHPNDSQMFTEKHQNSVSSSSSKKYRGTKLRDRFSYNIRMYNDEINQWIKSE